VVRTGSCSERADRHEQLALGQAGSGRLLRSLLDLDLVDELRLMLHPLVRERGKRLFNDGIEKVANLKDTRAFSSGITILTHEPGKKG
jgi:dihydrofolate reductase